MLESLVDIKASRQKTRLLKAEENIMTKEGEESKEIESADDGGTAIRWHESTEIEHEWRREERNHLDLKP